MVASTHWLASAAGMAVLEAGGNAFDAACAAGFTLEVVEPHLNGPGGDLPLLFAGPDHPPTVFCAQGTAPAGATIEHFRGLGLELIPGSGLLAAAVPGAVTGWLTLLRDHGTATLRQVTEAAIHYAATGIPVLPAIAAHHRRASPTCSAPSGRRRRRSTLDPGDWLRNPTWAATLQRLVGEAEAATSDRDGQLEHALRSWTTGFVAAEIDAFVRTPLWDSSGERHAGVLTADDLAALGAVLRTAGDAGLPRLDGVQDRPPGDRVRHCCSSWRCSTASTCGPGRRTSSTPSSRARSSRSPTARRGTATTRTSRWTRCCRPPTPTSGARSSGTPPTATCVPAARTAGRRGCRALLDLAAERRRGRRDHRRADGLAHRRVPRRHLPCLGRRPVRQPGGRDAERRLAALVPGHPGARLPAGHPGADDVARGRVCPTRCVRDAGRAPRCRRRLALRDGEPVLAFGTPGGDQQDQWQLGFFLNHVLGGMNLQESIDAPAFHSTHFPSSFYPRESYPKQS